MPVPFPSSDTTAFLELLPRSAWTGFVSPNLRMRCDFDITADINPVTIVAAKARALAMDARRAGTPVMCGEGHGSGFILDATRFPLQNVEMRPFDTIITAHVGVCPHFQCMGASNVFMPA